MFLKPLVIRSWQKYITKLLWRPPYEVSSSSGGNQSFILAGSVLPPTQLHSYLNTAIQNDRNVNRQRKLYLQNFDTGNYFCKNQVWKIYRFFLKNYHLGRWGTSRSGSGPDPTALLHVGKKQRSAGSAHTQPTAHGPAAKHPVSAARSRPDATDCQEPAHLKRPRARGFRDWPNLLKPGTNSVSQGPGSSGPPAPTRAAPGLRRCPGPSNHGSTVQIISFAASGCEAGNWGNVSNGRTVVCSLLSMATSTAAATALLRPRPAVPAKVKPYSIKLRTGTLAYFCICTSLTVACSWRRGGASMRLLGGRRWGGGELQGSCELSSTLSGMSASSEKPSR